MIKRDIVLIKYIKKHYSELLEELNTLKGFEDFCENMVVSKAIKMDILQIGENINHLSQGAKAQIDKKDLTGVIDFRNQVAHGYITLSNVIIWTTIKRDLPRIMQQIELIK